MSAWDDLVTLVNEQAEDEALWSVYPRGTQPIGEAYLQQELRRLHAAVELAIRERGTGGRTLAQELGRDGAG